MFKVCHTELGCYYSKVLRLVPWLDEDGDIDCEEEIRLHDTRDLAEQYARELAAAYCKGIILTDDQLDAISEGTLSLDDNTNDEWAFPVCT